jgi:integrase
VTQAAKRVGEGALSDRSIAEIIKSRAGAAGLAGTWSGHSLRRGFATQAYTAGVDELAIMRHGRWRSAAVRRTYIAEADRHRTDSPINALGLELPRVPPDREQRS